MSQTATWHGKDAQFKIISNQGNSGTFLLYRINIISSGVSKVEVTQGSTYDLPVQGTSFDIVVDPDSDVVIHNSNDSYVYGTMTLLETFSR